MSEHNGRPTILCPACGGTGKEGKTRCEGCGGDGRVEPPLSAADVTRCVTVRQSMTAYRDAVRTRTRHLEGWTSSLTPATRDAETIADERETERALLAAIVAVARPELVDALDAATGVASSAPAVCESATTNEGEESHSEESEAAA